MLPYRPFLKSFKMDDTWAEPRDTESMWQLSYSMSLLRSCMSATKKKQVECTLNLHPLGRIPLAGFNSLFCPLKMYSIQKFDPFMSIPLKNLSWQ